MVLTIAVWSRAGSAVSKTNIVQQFSWGNTHASHALMKGIPLPVVSKLLGHRRASKTLRYAHVVDREVEAAAERVGCAITRMCGFPVS